MFYNLTNKRPGNTWRDRVEELKAARAKYAELEPMMNGLDRVMLTNSINEKRAEVEPFVMNGVISEWQQAIDRFEQASKAVETARVKEIARWEASKFNDEMTVIERLVNSTVKSSAGGRLDPNVMPRLQKIYEDAQASQDPYKMRAAAEIMQGLPTMVGPDFDDRKQANRIAQRAQKDVQGLRITEEMKAADQVAAAAVQALNQAKSVLFEVDGAMGYTLPNGEVGSFELFKQMHRVKTAPNGEIAAIVPVEQALISD